MEHGASELVKEESHMVMTVKAEVDKAAQCTAYHGVQTNANFTEEEPGFVELVKSEPALLVKEEVVEDGSQDIAEQQCMQGLSTSAIVGSTNMFDTIGDLHNTLSVKEELGAIDIGPTVLQHTDTQGTNNQKDMIVVKQECAVYHDKTDPILCVGVKEEINEDKRRGSLTPQDSLMEQPGACTALHSLRKECLETVCRVELIRLDTFQCEVCDAVYIDAHTLLQHVQDVHGPGPRGSLCQHVKSPQISKEGLQCATVTSPVIYTCDYCLKTYTSKQGLVQHIDVVHTNVRYRCSECNKEYKGKLYLQAHIRRVHSKEKHEFSSPVVYTCDYCHKTYTSKLGLVYHIEVVHTKVRYRCSECNRKYTGKHLLQAHIRRAHSKEKHEADTDAQRSNKAAQRKQRAQSQKQRAQSQSYSCDKCTKTFPSKYTVLRHNRNRHSRESHKCTKCNKKFPSKAYLYQHTRQVHSEQEYECAVCKKMCKSKPALNNHVYGVHRPRPAGSHQQYTCTNCGRNFKLKWNCQQHKKRSKCARSTAGNTSAAASTSRQQRNVDIVKEEPADGEVELGPVVFQHMDCNYRPYKPEPRLD